MPEDSTWSARGPETSENVATSEVKANKQRVLLDIKPQDATLQELGALQADLLALDRPGWL